jgi:DNA-binding MarR family transcriptional regulator
MKDSKEKLIRQAVGFQEEVNRIILGYRPEKWMALDLTIAQLKSIVYISSKGRVNFKELARALNVSPPVVTGIVDRLTSQRLINRIADTGDRRIQWLTVGIGEKPSCPISARNP